MFSMKDLIKVNCVCVCVIFIWNHFVIIFEKDYRITYMFKNIIKNIIENFEESEYTKSGVICFFKSLFLHFLYPSLERKSSTRCGRNKEGKSTLCFSISVLIFRQEDILRMEG